MRDFDSFVKILDTA